MRPSWFDALLFGVRYLFDESGSQMPERAGLKFVGVSVVDDPVNGRTTVTISGAGAGAAGDGLQQTGNVLSVKIGDASLAISGGSLVVGVISNTQHGNRGGGALHAAANGSTAGFIDATNWSAINGRSATPASGTVVVWGSSSELNASAFVGPGTTSTIGVLRAANDSVVVAARTLAGFDAALLTFDAANVLIVGAEPRVAALSLVCHSGPFEVAIGGSAAFTVTAGIGASVDAHNRKIVGVVVPTADDEAATKGYVDDQIGYAFLNLTYADFVVDGMGQTTMFIDLDSGAGGTGHVNNGAGAGCPAGAVAMGVRWQLNQQFAGGVGTTLIKMSVGIPGSFKQLVDVPIDSTSPPTATAYASFDNNDCGGSISSSYFQVEVTIVGGPDLSTLAAGDLVLRCFYMIPKLL